MVGQLFQQPIVQPDDIEDCRIHSVERTAILQFLTIYRTRILSSLHWLDGQKITLLSLLRRLFMSCAIYVEEKKKTQPS